MDSRNLIEELKKNTLLYGLDEMVGAWEMVRFLKIEKKLGDLTLIRLLVIQAATELVQEGLMIFGDIGFKFIPWKISLPEALLKVKSAWDKLERAPNPWEVFYLDLTDIGRVRALAEYKGNG